MSRISTPCYLLLLALLSGCGDAPKRQPPSSAASVAGTPPADPTQRDSLPIPYGPPAAIARVDYASYDNMRRAEGTLDFTDSIDQRIAEAALPPGPEARERCEFTRYVPDDRLDEDECCNAWTPWLTEFCALDEFRGRGEASDTTTGRYPRPVPVPNAAGRQLFLAESSEFGPIVLLEFRGGRYRARVLGRHNVFGGIRHRLYGSARAELLLFENTYGHMGAGRGSSGQAVTWLQVYDLRRDQWAFSACIGRTEEYHGYTADDGREVPSRYFEASRPYTVRDQGRTIVLGRYQQHTAEGASPDETMATGPDLPAGTYRLVAGRYRRVAK